jgi:hypothetical protein
MPNISGLSSEDIADLLVQMFITQQDIDDYKAGVSVLGRLRTVNDINTV